MAKHLIVLCLLLTCTLAASKINPLVTEKIVGGEKAGEGAYPWQVSVRKFGLHSCGGSIIRPEWVLTAAHCVVGTIPLTMTVVAGTNHVSKGGDSYQAIKIISNKNYEPWSIQNDIALIHVKPITFNDVVKPIRVEYEDIAGGIPLVFSGWGATRLGGAFSQTLHQINLRSVTVDECKAKHSIPIILTQLCTFTKEGEGICTGDAGGPLVRFVEGEEPRLAGVASWGRPCAVGYPDVFTRVSSFFDWINENCNNCVQY